LLPAAARYFLISVFVFAPCQRKNENNQKIEYRSAEGYDAVQYATVCRVNVRLSMFF